MDRPVDELDLAEIGAEILAQELVMIARQHHHAGAALGLLHQQLDELVVDRRPVPGAGEAPAIDDVAHEVDRIRLVVLEEIDQLRDARRPHAEMHVAEEERADVAGLGCAGDGHGARNIVALLR